MHTYFVLKFSIKKNRKVTIHIILLLLFPYHYYLYRSNGLSDVLLLFIFFDYHENEMSRGTRIRLLLQHTLTYCSNVKRKMSSFQTSTNCAYYYYIRTRAVLPTLRVSVVGFEMFVGALL